MKKRYPFGLKNCLQIGFTVAFSFLAHVNVLAQTAPAIQWDKAFGAPGNETFSSVQVTADGGYILGGISTSGTSGDKTQAARGGGDYWIVKLNAAGTKQWDKTFGGTGTEVLGSVQQTSDGGYIVGGSSASVLSGDKTQAANGVNDYWIVKTDSLGNKIWDKSFGGSQEDYFRGVRQTTDGGYLVAGYSRSGISADKSQPSKGLFDFWIIKLDASGTKLWDKSFGGTGTDALFTFQQTSDGGYLLGGPSDSGISSDKSQASKGNEDYWILKTDAAGNKLWDLTIGGSAADHLHALQQTADGGYLLGGHSYSGISGDKTHASQGDADMWIVKLNSSVTKLWDRSFGGSNTEFLHHVKETTGGGFILTGSSLSNVGGDKSEPSRGARDGWVVRTDAAGNKLWDKTLGGSLFDVVSSSQQASDGSLIIGGYSESGISGDRTAPLKGGTDYWLIKFMPEPLGLSADKSSFWVSVFPNPGQGKFNVQLNKLTFPIVEVTVSDLLGRVVLQQEFKTSNNQLSEEISLPNVKGVYLLQLKAGKNITSRKIVIE